MARISISPTGGWQVNTMPPIVVLILSAQESTIVPSLFRYGVTEIDEDESEFDDCDDDEFESDDMDADTDE